MPASRSSWTAARRSRSADCVAGELADQEAEEDEDEANERDRRAHPCLAAEHLHRDRGTGRRRVAGAATPRLVAGDVGILLLEMLVAVPGAFCPGIAERDQRDSPDPQ